MTINRITIVNIASITRATIDFTAPPVKGEHIVLICGHTGAGKSTVFDAICLALYNDTPRLKSVPERQGSIFVESIGQNVSQYNPLHLVRRGAGEALAELQFVGNDGITYVSSWSVTRKVKGSKGLNEPQRVLRDINGAIVATGKNVNECIVRLAGMDFTQFCRTTMLAQGDFTRFLRSTGDEKSAILMRLTRTERFEQMSRRIYQLHADAKRAVDEARVNRDSIATRCKSDEEITSMRKQLATVTAEVEELNSRREQISVRLTWLERRARLVRMETDLQQTVDSDVRRAFLALTAADEALYTQLQHYIPGVKSPEEITSALNADIRAAKDDGLAIETDIAVAMGNYDECRVGEIKEKQEQLDSRLTTIGRLREQLAVYAERVHAVDDCARAEQEVQLKLDALQQQQPLLDGRVATALNAFTVASTTLENVQFSVNDAVNEVRNHVHEGEECPVCGNLITRVLSNEHFTSALRPLERARDDAERALREAQTDAKVNAQATAQAVAAAERAGKNTRQARAAAGSVSDNISVMTTTLGLTGNDLSTLPSTLDALEENIAGQMSRLSEAQERATLIQKHIGELREKRQAALTREHRHSERLQTFNIMLQQHEQARVTIERALSLRPAWRETVAGVNGDASDISRLTSVLQSVLDKTAGMRDNIDKQHRDLELTRPVNIDEQADISTLSVEIEAITRRVTELNRAIGALNTQIEFNKQLREHLERADAHLEQSIQHRARFARLDELFGGSDGKKLRNIALGLILGDLLHQANAYLQRFDAHYELYNDEDSLNIMMRDMQMGGTPTTTVNLSGGEAFMVSLALALALAHMGSDNLTADTLFIDEGFGTLSDDVLENVINTLEQLHNMCGKRVVLISHVAALQERIPTRLHVVNGQVRLA